MGHAHAAAGTAGNVQLPAAGLTRSALAIGLGRRGYSVTWLAGILGLHRSTIINWQRGGRPSPLAALAASDALLELGLDPALLFTPGSDPLADITDLDAVRRARGLTNDDTPTNEEQPMSTPREYLEPEDLEHFCLAADPFDEAEDPEDVWMPKELRQVEVAIEMAARRLTILAVTGPAGAGKSTLVRRFYGAAGRAKNIRLVAPASLDRRRITSAALAVAVIRDLTGRETSSMAMEPRSNLLREVLEDQDRAGQRPVLLIDEAHLLKPEALIALKQIWDSHTLFRRIAMVLVGQPLLESRLRTDPTIREVTGRTRIVTLKPLKEKDAADYLRWRFARVGCDADQVFDRGAYRALAELGEYPLWINNRAVSAMRHAHGIGDKLVTAASVARA